MQATRPVRPARTRPTLLHMNVVLVGYTPAKTRAALAFCSQAFRKLPIRQRVLVLNRGDSCESVAVPGWDVVRGSNELAEFSGWQEGLARLSETGQEDAVIFINDTVASHRRFSMFRRWAFVREAWCADRRCIVGFTDHTKNDIGDLSIAGLVLQGWVSTYCFMLGADALSRLRYRLWEPEVVDRCVRGGIDEATFFTDELSADLQRQLRRWLFEGGWYRSEPLTSANTAMFTQKARTICAEMLLSARCWALGCGRHDPFERHPLAYQLDDRTEQWARRLRLSRGEWARHPLPWARSPAPVQPYPPNGSEVRSSKE